MPKRGYLIIYAVLVAAVVLGGSWVWDSITIYQRRGVVATAQLVRYFETGAGRGGSFTIWGVVRYQTASGVYQSAVPIGSSKSYRDFIDAKSSGIVQIVYDPRHPTSVAFNGHDEVQHRHPGQIAFWFIFIGVGLLTLVFTPVFLLL